MSRLVDPLPPGAFTVGGKTAGPAVNMGRNRYNKSQLIFLDEGDVRHAVSAFSELGFANPEIHQQTLDEVAAKTAELDQANATITELQARVASLEETVGFKTHAAEAEAQAALVPDLQKQLEAALAALSKAKQAAAKPEPKSKPKAKAKRTPKKASAGKKS